MRSLWTLRRDPDVWSVTTKTWQMQSETIMRIKLKIIKKTNKNPLLIFASKFHQISWKEILKSCFFFSTIAISYQFSSLLIFLQFLQKYALWSVHLLRVSSQSGVLWRLPSRAVCLLCCRPISGERCGQHSDPHPAIMKCLDDDWSQSVHRLNHCLKIYVQLAVVKFRRLRLHVCFLFRSKSFFILLL